MTYSECAVQRCPAYGVRLIVRCRDAPPTGSGGVCGAGMPRLRCPVDCAVQECLAHGVRGKFLLRDGMSRLEGWKG